MGRSSINDQKEILSQKKAVNGNIWTILSFDDSARNALSGDLDLQESVTDERLLGNKCLHLKHPEM